MNDPAVKEVNRRIRVAMKLWAAHRNAACRQERRAALTLYEALSKSQREGVPQDLRVWLRYRSVKYFGEGRKGHGANSGKGGGDNVKKDKKAESARSQWDGIGEGEAGAAGDDGSWDDW